MGERAPVRADDGVDSAGRTWEKIVTTPPTRCRLMHAEPSQGWNVFHQIVAEHWDGFTQAPHREDTPSYDALVNQMLECGHPEKMGSIA